MGTYVNVFFQLSRVLGKWTNHNLCNNEQQFYIFYRIEKKRSHFLRTQRFQESALCQLDLVAPLGNKIVLLNYQSHFQTLVPLETCQSFRAQLSGQKSQKKILYKQFAIDL